MINLDIKEKNDFITKNIIFNTEKLKSIMKSSLFDKKLLNSYNQLRSNFIDISSFSINDEEVNFIKNTTSLVLENILDKLEKNNYFIIYSKYETLNNINFPFKIDVNEIDMDKFIFKINKLINNEYIFEIEILENKYSDYIYNNNKKEIKSGFSSDTIQETIENINSNFNNYMLEKLKEIKWYDYVNKQKKKEINENNKIIYNNYNLEKQKITKTLNTIIKNYDKYNYRIGFLKEILNDNYFEELQESFFERTSIKETLKKIKNYCQSYKEYIKLKNKVDELSISEYILLKLAFKNSNTKFEFRETLNNIMKFKKYIYIKEKNNNQLIKEEYFSRINKIVLYNNKYLNCENSNKNLTNYKGGFINNNDLNNNIIYKYLLYIVNQLGFEIKINKNIENIFMELVIVGKKAENPVIYIHFDYFINDLDYDLERILYLETKNIKTIYIWSSDWFNDFIHELNNFKLKLKSIYKLKK